MHLMQAWKQRKIKMKTERQKETEAFLAIAEALKVLEQQLADAKQRIADLEDLLKHK